MSFILMRFSLRSSRPLRQKFICAFILKNPVNPVNSSAPKNDAVEDKLVAARTWLIIDKPFLGALVLRLPLVEVDDSERAEVRRMVDSLRPVPA